MIKVVVADYCQNCPRFEAAAGKMNQYIEKDAQGGTEQHADTEIRCANASNCAAIEAHLRKKIENESKQLEPEKEPKAVLVPEKQESKWTKWWKRLRDRLCWIDVWDVLDAAFVVFAVAAAILMLLLLVLFSVGIVRLLLGI